mmetsp:Transcript_1231/g.3657  ORF Transcript_1231/g.3657 Transcript_1231/m.3657 type:complete len:200 (-) Transcript_1231:235-834(-)
MSPRASKSRSLHFSAARQTFSMCGNRNSRPECTPVPSPTEESTPRPTHHSTNSAHSSASATDSSAAPVYLRERYRVSSGNARNRVAGCRAATAVALPVVPATLVAKWRSVARGARHSVKFRRSIAICSCNWWMRRRSGVARPVTPAVASNGDSGGPATAAISPGSSDIPAPVRVSTVIIDSLFGNCCRGVLRRRASRRS